MKLRDLTNKQFGLWTVIDLSEERASCIRRRKWDCVCACGTKRPVAEDRLRSGEATNCGCLAHALSIVRMRKMSTKHGLSHTPEHAVWKSMIQRCYNPNVRRYVHYGGRGITVCPQWIESFDQFWSDMGPRPSSKHSLDRKDNNGNYETNNCQWSTRYQQARNRSTTIFLEYDGKSLPIPEWADITGIPWRIIHARRRLNWDTEKILSTPYTARNLLKKK